MSIKSNILSYLRGEDFVYGGQIDEAMHDELGRKSSNISRRCRELYEDGLLERKLVKVDGKGPFVVMYKYRVPIVPIFRTRLDIDTHQSKLI